MIVRRGMLISLVSAALLVVIAWSPSIVAAQGEPKTIRIAKQYGIGYLPLILIEAESLLEKQSARLGLDVKVEWVQFTGGTPMNEALISERIDLASGGVGPLLLIWARTRGGLDVKGVAALNAMPIFLTTINPDVATLVDFSEADRIALPSIRISIQAVTLQMAAEKRFGPGEYERLDPLTVSMSHPDAHTALMSGASGVTAHFGAAPYMYAQLADPRVRKVLDSYEVLGGPHTFNLVWATRRFNDENPKVMRAFRAALDEAMRRIAEQPGEVAKIWIASENSRMSAAEAEALIRKPENEWTTVPKKIMVYADFMNRTGLLPDRPKDWREVFFEQAHDLPGN